MSWTENPEYRKTVAELRREADEIKARRESAGPLPPPFTAPPPRAAPPPAAGPPPPRRAPPPPPTAAHPPSPFPVTKAGLDALFDAIIDAAKNKNLAEVNQLISLLSREQETFKKAIDDGNINTDSLKAKAKKVLLSLHPDKTGTDTEFKRIIILVKDSGLGILSGEGKSKKCRKCGLYKI